MTNNWVITYFLDAGQNEVHATDNIRLQLAFVCFLYVNNDNSTHRYFVYLLYDFEGICYHSLR